MGSQLQVIGNLKIRLGRLPPSGDAVNHTFLFTDIEGSTRRWEADPVAMQHALDAHDSTLRGAIERYGGHVFKHTGDGMCAWFASPSAAVRSAIDAQRKLELPVRMGIASGEANERDGDYFGPALNRTARIMSAGHGGQVLLADASEAGIESVQYIDLGERRLRDLSGVTRLYQVRAEGLAVEFPPLRTVDLSPGNLPIQPTSFLGRDLEVKALAELVRQHRLLSLTGPGGVGKTRIALQVAAGLVTEFPDGVWFVELAPLRDGHSVPDAVARVLSATGQADRTLTASIVQAIGGRRLLLVLDNCEHVLDAVAELVDTVLSCTQLAKILVTSREGLQLRPEHRWPVPPLDVADGVHSSAFSLFLERARAADPTFSLDHPIEVNAAVEICRHLDGLPLAIELAAARMVSMSVVEVHGRLDQRFRLLTGSRRGQANHQTLRQTLQWSYDLLDPDEQGVLDRASVFAGGFDLDAAAAVCAFEGMDEYEVLDILDSLVRKSLLNVERVGTRARYAMLESVRQFSLDRLSPTDFATCRIGHAGYFARRARDAWDESWNGSGDEGVMSWIEVMSWIDSEFDNLRAGFRFAKDHAQVEDAAMIAAHATLLAFALQRYEPVGWSEEILPAAIEADLAILPRVYSAAALCTYVGRPEDAVVHARAGLALEGQPGYDGFEPGWTAFYEAIGHRFAGRVADYVAISTAMSEQSGLVQLIGQCALIFALPLIGRSDKAMTLAEQTITAARDRGNPFLIAWAYNAYGRAYSERMPARALDAFREGLEYTRENRVPFWEANIARDAAALEAAHGERSEALWMFEQTINTFHRTGNVGHTAATVASLAMFFARIDQPAIAATLYGACQRHPSINMVIGLPPVLDELQAALGSTDFDRCTATGMSMEWADAVRHALQQIYAVRNG